MQAELTLQESEQRYRRIVETATEGIWMIDADNKTTFVNQEMARMLGYTVEELADRSPVLAIREQTVEARRRPVAGRPLRRRRNPARAIPPRLCRKWTRSTSSGCSRQPQMTIAANHGEGERRPSRGQA